MSSAATSAAEPIRAERCTTCGSEIATGLLACPGCHRFTHAATLAALKNQAEHAAAAGDHAAELEAWTSALALVPPSSQQYIAINSRLSAVGELRARAAAAPPEIPKSGPWKWLGGLGTAGAVFWKFKFLALAMLGKGKLLILGLTKASTFLSMFLAFGVYWTAWGVWFALGFVLSIYVHEMGHMAALHQFGVPSSAPMFVPGFGAFIRLRGRELPPYQNARVGLAGPLWGLGAALAALAASRAGGGPMFAAVAHTGAWINLFNLMPVWQLDGNRGFAALSRSERWMVALTFGVAWILTHDGIIVLLIVAAAVQSLDAHAPGTGDRGALGQFLFLILALSGVLLLAR